MGGIMARAGPQGRRAGHRITGHLRQELDRKERTRGDHDQRPPPCRPAGSVNAPASSSCSSPWPSSSRPPSATSATSSPAAPWRALRPRLGRLRGGRPGRGPPVGDVITYLPPADSGIDTWSRTGSSASRQPSAPRATPTPTPTRGPSSSPRPRSRGSPTRCPTSATSSSRSRTATLRMLLIGVPARHHRAGQPGPARPGLPPATGQPGRPERPSEANGPGRGPRHAPQVPLLASALLLGAGAFSGVQASGATFTDTSATPLNVFSAPDWTAPDVTMVDPGYAVTGTVTVNATATDGDSSITNVQIQRAPHGSSTWTTICTDNVAPYSCCWDTTPLTDGDYDLRAVATDAHSNTPTSSLGHDDRPERRGRRARPGRRPGARHGHPDRPHRQRHRYGDDRVPGLHCRHEQLVRHPRVRRRRRPAPHLPGRHDRRSPATTTGGPSASSAATPTTTSRPTSWSTTPCPTITLAVPAAPLSGTVNMTGTASDGHSGVASVRFEYRQVGVASWTTCALDTSFAPTRARSTPPGLSDGNYEFRDDGHGRRRQPASGHRRRRRARSATAA